MSNTILQVPIDKDLRNQAAAAAKDLGFSSLQEAVRIFLKQLVKKQIGFWFRPSA